MLRARFLCCALWIASCADHASPLDRAADHATSGAAGSDPWSGPSGKPRSGEGGRSGESGRSGDKRESGGFDLQAMLAGIAENITKPGPYEAPDKSIDFDSAKPHWGVLTLGGEVVEQKALSFTGGHGLELRALALRLREFARDDKLTGMVVRVDELTISMPDLIELRAAIHDVQKAGKVVACHAERAHNAAYLVLAACDRIGLAPLGELSIGGPTAMPIHLKSLLDKLGIQADFLHIGAYKGAAEPLTRDAPSKEMEETLGAILDRRYRTMADVIARDRKLPPATVTGLIDTALFPSEQAKAEKLVDDVDSFEAFRDGVRNGAPWQKLELESDKADRLAMMMKLSRFLGALPAEKPAGNHLAVVYAIGDIVDGSDDGVLGARQQIAAQTLVPALRAIAADDTVKAVVLRIDSGGGSAQASELIWRAVAELRAQKPVIVSMSDVAASGGYYIASGATKIFALDDTLTGSIGVVGGKLAPREALAKIGVHTFPMGRGKRATMMANLGPWTDDERAAGGSWGGVFCGVFLGRVADGRHKTPEAIRKLAEGRVWTGAQARELGLVDEIGGLDAALAEAQRLAKIDPKVDLEIYPPAPTLHDVLASFGQVHAPVGVMAAMKTAALAAITDLGALDPTVAAATEHLVTLVLSFRSATVQAVAMLPVLP